MKRREFVQGAAAGSAAVALGAGAAPAWAEAKKPTIAPAMPKRPYGKDGAALSIIGFPGLVLRRGDQEQANRLIAEAFKAGINYFDVAPAYGDAEVKMGPALEPFRKHVFLSCKTKMRDAKGAKREFERSLQRLRTDHFDLYQMHCLMDVKKDVDAAFAKGGAMEVLQAERKAGRIRYLGFSAHTEETAMAAMERFRFDSVMFPISFASWLKVGFGPKVVKKAIDSGSTVIAIKGFCRQRWEAGDPLRRKYRMWYKPTHDRNEAILALRWTISQGVASAIPPANADILRLATSIAHTCRPVTKDETAKLAAIAKDVTPLFPHTPRKA